MGHDGGARHPRYSTHPAALGVDPVALAAELRRELRGGVRFDTTTRAAYATDASNFRQVPIGVVEPADIEDLVAAVGVCAAHGAPVTHRGGGTSLAGQATNVAVVIDSSRHVDRIVGVDPAARLAVVEPGVVLDRLREQAAVHGLTFGPDPSTHSRCTLGGMLGNNACGMHSVVTGRTSDNVVSLDVLLYDGTRLTVGTREEAALDRLVGVGGRAGEVYGRLRALRDRHAPEIRRRFPAIPRRVSGYNLDALLPEAGFNLAAALVGTEGTCVTTLGATVRLVPRPGGRAVVVLGYPDVATAGDDVPAVLDQRPEAVEAVDQHVAAAMPGGRTGAGRALPEGNAFLLVEFAGEDRADAVARAGRAGRTLAGAGGASALVLDDERRERALWEMRETALATAAAQPGAPPAWPGWEDAAVPPDRVGPYLRDLAALYGRYGYGAPVIYGHFGDGCVHSRIPFDLTSPVGVARYRDFLDDAAGLVVSHGGSLSGEHGDGQQRGPLLERMFGAELVRAFREFKAVWDPDGRMNPGKVVDPVRAFAVDENLRLGAGYRAAEPALRFRLPLDDGSMSRAALRCVGVGKCRQLGGQTMCPSFMATGDEVHSTRGRARLLFEMLDGGLVRGGWRAPEVAEALDLCLSCKGCRTDCPAGVDMATYKAEFLSHHYRGRLRPRPAYAMGLIMYAVRAGSLAPRAANGLLHSGITAGAVRRVAGIHPDRPVPSLAPQTFRRWFAHQPAGAAADRGSGAAVRPVVLFPDTFTDHFDPDVGRATAAVLGAAGFRVTLPRRWLCCGRPLFDYGMLDLARRLYRRTLAVLSDEIAAGTPVVVPEPSCAASFRDELVDLLADDPEAHRLAGSVCSLPEFLARHAPGWQPPAVGGRVLLQTHCHEHGVLDRDAERALLERTGAVIDAPATGCCGLAGSWGYERDKHRLSLAIGERSVFPAVRAAGGDTAVVADGFSCRSQIGHGTGRRAVHVAQLLAGATSPR